MIDDPDRNTLDVVELVVYDNPEPCPYLPGQVARMPLRMPAARLTPAQFDLCLARGDRRSGSFLYRTACPTCRACEPMRIGVEHFAPSRGQRRVLRRGRRELTVEVGEPEVSRGRVELYNAHRHGRGLARQDGDIDESGYEAFLVDSCCATLEIRYRQAGRLIAVAICDVGQTSLSAVYCYFDPACSHLSPGTFSILTEIDLCRRWGKQFLYLGLYIAASPHMNYKAQFLPHERLIDRQWQRFDHVRTRHAQ